VDGDSMQVVLMTIMGRTIIVEGKI